MSGWKPNGRRRHPLLPGRSDASIVLTFVIYTQALILTVLYCAAACPFLLLFLLFNCFSVRRMRGVVRFFILWYGKAVIYLGWYPYVRVRFENGSGGPARGGIYICNHRSSSDPFLAAAFTLSRPPAQVVNRWPMRLPFFGFFARLGGYLDVTAHSYEEAREWAREMVNSDVPVVVFPEGTRSGNREMNQFHGTFFRIAKELDCRLVPVAITGNEHCPDRNFRMSRGKVRVCLLPEVDRRIVRETPPFQLKNLVRRILMEQTRKMDAAG